MPFPLFQIPKFHFFPFESMVRADIGVFVAGVWLNGHFHFHWKNYSLPMEHLEQLDFTKGYTKGLPAFYRFTLDAEESCDTYIDFTGWGKGCVLINGFILGRFWEIGPQKRLYLLTGFFE